MSIILRRAFARSLAIGLGPAALAWVFASPLHAQDPGPLVTDRPDQTESSEVVGAGLFQLEAGWTYAVASDDVTTVRAHAVPEALLRIGLADVLEARIGFSGWISVDVDPAMVGPGSEASGIGDPDLGFKLRLLEGDGAKPAIAFIGTATIPVGSSEFTSDRVDPSARLTLAHDLSERLSLGYNVGVQWTTFPAAVERLDTHTDLLYTLALGIGLTERLGAFVESFGFFALDDQLGSRHSLDGGFTYLVSDNLQLDTAAGLGLTTEADSWFFGLGLSVRLPR